MAKNFKNITDKWNERRKKGSRRDLEKKLAERLSGMSETDIEELIILYDQVKAKQAAQEAKAEREEQARLAKQQAADKRDEGVLEGQVTFDAIVKAKTPPQAPAQSQAPEQGLQERVEEFYKSYDVFEQKDPERKKWDISSKMRWIAACAIVLSQKVKTNVKKAVIGLKKAANGLKRAMAGLRDVVARLILKLKRQIERASESERASRRQRAAKYVFLQYKRRFKRKEKKASASMAGFIVRMDERNDEIAEKTTRIVVKSNRRFNSAREWADLNKRKLILLLVAIVLISLGVVASINQLTAYEYAYNGRTLGMVKKQEEVLKVLEVVSGQLTREYGTEVDIDEQQDITFNRVMAMNKEIDDMHDVLNRLTYMQDMNVKAYALYIDGKRIAILDTKETAEAILQEVKDQFTGREEYASVSFEEVSFAENVEIRQLDTQLGRVQNPDDVMQQILTGAVEQKVHIVQKGETFSEIARSYGMTQAELEATNPGINPARLNIEQQIILTQAVPLVTVQTVEIATYIEPIPYETIYEENANIFKGEQTVKVKGINGEREVTARLFKNNGIEIGKEELSSNIIFDASSAVVSIGTKEPPPLQGTGTFIYPVQGARLTSKFGMRSGRMHNAIDLACPTGTRISASDGGTVIFAGYSGSYGYVVKINHGRNYVTVYAHCSKLFVKKGDKVYQGQHIANVGNTGRSTGPHCHFEIQVNGVPKNPLNYL